MKTATEIINDVAIWLLVGFAAFLVWFFKEVYSQHKLIYDYYSKNKETDIQKLILEVNALKKEIEKVESESKKYWQNHKLQMESNQIILLERINHTNDNNKAASKMLGDFIDTINNRFDRLEDRVNNINNGK